MLLEGGFCPEKGSSHALSFRLNPKTPIPKFGFQGIFDTYLLCVSPRFPFAFTIAEFALECRSAAHAEVLRVINVRYHIDRSGQCCRCRSSRLSCTLVSHLLRL